MFLVACVSRRPSAAPRHRRRVDARSFGLDLHPAVGGQTGLGGGRGASLAPGDGQALARRLDLDSVLLDTLAGLKKYAVGTVLDIGGESKKITEVISIDGTKMILEDNSWLMIRPSGTEPKVRFYVEARSEAGKDGLFAAAKGMLGEIGLL